MELHEPPLRKDGLQLQEHRSFQNVFWTVERIAWITFALMLVLAILGLTGSGGYFAKANATLPAGSAEYPRVSRWETSDEFRVMFEAGGETRRLTIGNPFFKYFQIEGVQPQPERSRSVQHGVMMEFAADEGAPVDVTFYVRSLRPGIANYRVGLDGADTLLRTVILP
ncbi:hypothetical protein [Chelativorans sp. Marseille-P2723]|uniref:hypothetical protein n=1 Tax=Chelativorans sp. Marseille-P2723 TaxID=2709133 RepID=UPI00156D893F|nr:hypothetical protein [Chelativorans sp. Marseille-P2723]